MWTDDGVSAHEVHFGVRGCRAAEGVEARSCKDYISFSISVPPGGTYLTDEVGSGKDPLPVMGAAELHLSHWVPAAKVNTLTLVIDHSAMDVGATLSLALLDAAPAVVEMRKRLRDGAVVEAVGLADDDSDRTDHDSDRTVSDDDTGSEIDEAGWSSL